MTATKATIPIMAFLALFFLHLPGFATTYYVHPVLGNDQNPGISVLKPFRSLESIRRLTLTPGDSVLLAAGHTFEGSLVLKNIEGTKKTPIVISSYFLAIDRSDRRAIIDAHGYANGISLENCSNITVNDLIITANAGRLQDVEKKEEATMRCGVLVKATFKESYENIELSNVWIKDIFFEEEGFERGRDEVRTANGTQSYGWGIRVINLVEGATIKGIRVKSCVVENVAHTGIKFTSGHEQGIQDIQVLNNRVLRTGGPGIQMSRVSTGIVRNNFVNRSGSNDDSRKWGRGSGLWTWGSTDVVIEKNYFMNANGPGDSAGCHIDFNCRNVVVQYNFSANNAGGFCEILGNNHNCAYRYNISVNDGHRVKGENGAFQEGKIFWLSGYVGRGKQRKGPFNSYFYNNTMYVSRDIVAKVAVAKVSAGVFIVNNIFCIEGESKAVEGDQYNPEKSGGSQIKNVVFKNNLYLKDSNWPNKVWIEDADKILGDPDFVNKEGLEITDFVPRNVNLVQNKGIEITKIPGDSVGLAIGLKAKHDILGNKIVNTPDIGAIELD